MDNTARLWSQIAAESGLTANRAKVAAYALNLAQDGRTLEYAAKALRRSRTTLEKLSREFMIDWPDYRPFAAQEKKGGRPEPRAKLSL